MEQPKQSSNDLEARIAQLEQNQARLTEALRNANEIFRAVKTVLVGHQAVFEHNGLDAPRWNPENARAATKIFLN